MNSTTAALVLATAPIMTGFLAAIFLKEKLTLRMILGSLIALFGIYLVVTKNGGSIEVNRGLLWVVVTMVTFAIMIVITRKLSQRLDPVSTTLYSNIIGFILAIPFAVTLENPADMGREPWAWAFLIVTAVTVNGIATIVWNIQIRYAEASKASILSNIEPFVAMILGVIILQKPITLPEIFGSFFIVGGVVLATYMSKKRVT